MTSSSPTVDSKAPLLVAAPSSPAEAAWAALAEGFQETVPDTFSEMNKSTKKDRKFQSIGNGLYRKGNRIYLRIQTPTKSTWKSTKTNSETQAKKFQEKWKKDQWLREAGVLEEKPKPPQKTTAGRTVNELIEEYQLAGSPRIRKGKLYRKEPRSVQNENYSFNPIRAYFGTKVANVITLADCDRYHAWRLGGGYVAEFTVRGHKVTRQTKGGDRAIDLELTALSNVFALAVRRGHLAQNPIQNRGKYDDESSIRHCREVAPTPEGLRAIARWMRKQGFSQDADQTEFLAYTGLRIGESLKVSWDHVDWDEEFIRVNRLKRGVFPFVVILPECMRLLKRMKKDAESKLLFPSPFDSTRPRDPSAFRRRLAAACRKLKLGHVTPHGLRSYFVTQARQSGLTDAEIAQLIGDQTGPSLIAEVYGDVRPNHLMEVARKIKITATGRKCGKGKGGKKP